MKLSDFGLCKPLDCSNLSPINENDVMTDENLRESMDDNGCFPDNGNGSRWKSPLEQLQHWQMNRRTLVSKIIFSSFLIVYVALHDRFFTFNFQNPYLATSWLFSTKLYKKKLKSETFRLEDLICNDALRCM